MPKTTEPLPTASLQLAIADAIETATEHREALDAIRTAAEQVIAETERQRDVLQTGVLVANEIIAAQRDLTKRLDRWTRSVSSRVVERDDDA